MDKRYQVFVSSTFEDLREERSAAIEALLRIDCIPAGMELFPAADDDSWTLIKSVIDDCDYYLVIVAGRYGSISPGTTRSYTHLEYEYALEIGKPTIALIHSKPGELAAGKCERSEEGRKRLEEFRADLRKKNCRLWADRAELVSGVFTGVQHLKKTRPAVGWVKSNAVPDSAKDELLRLRGQVDTLDFALAAACSRNAPDDVDQLAKGAETTRLSVQYPDEAAEWKDVRWDDIIRAVLPQTYGGGASARDVASALVGLMETETRKPESSATLSRSDYGKVMNQLVALGLVEPRPHPHAITETQWFATPYGQKVGSRMVSIKKAEAPF